MSDTVVTAKFVADTTSLQAGAQRVTTSLRGVDDGVRKTAMSMNALKGGFIAAGAAVGMLALKMGVDAVKAAAEEEKAVVKLGTALKNVGQEFRLGEVEKFVDDLQRASGVADDELRPALQTLITATGNATQAQDLLGSALDISAATGRDLTSVSIALAKASNGQFMQINRLTNGAINPAILSTKDLGLVTAELERLYGGQAQANAETFAGKIDRLTIAYEELLEAFGTGFIEGITSASDATEDMGNAFRAAEPGMREFGKTLGELGLIISYVSPFFDDVVNLFKFAVPSALAGAAAAFPPLIPLVSYIGTTFLGSKASVDAFANSVDIIGVKFTGPMSAAAQAASTGIRDVGDAAEEAAEELAAMKAEMDLFLASTGQISAVDNAAESIDNLGKASVEFGTNLMGQSPKARDFRAEVVDAFEASAKAAQSLSDDLPTQRAIFTGELIKIVASLRASGVKDKDIEAFLGSMKGLPASVADIMRGAAKAIGDTDFKTQVQKAFDKSVKAGAPMTADAMERLATGASNAAKEKLGLTLEPELAGIIKSGTTALRPTAFLNGQLTGKSIGSGLANGISASSPIVQAAIRRVIEQAKAAADAAAETGSPSRLFARTGDDVGAGLALGITRSSGKVSAAAQELINQLLKSVRSALAPAMGTMESAIASVLANLPSVKEAEQALKDNDTAANRAALAFAKYAESNRKALRALQELGAGFDYILTKMDSVTGALTELQELTAKPFGIESNVFSMFSRDTDIEGIARNATELISVVTEAFGVLTDPKIVGAKAARENRERLRGTIGQITALAQEGIDLRKKYEANLQAIADLEVEYQQKVDGINDKYDELEKAGQDNLAGLEKQLSEVNSAYERENGKLQQLISERSNFLDGVTQGFRSFVNDFKNVTTSATRVIGQSTRTLADGITLAFDVVEEVTGTSSMAANLRKRLDDVKAFAANVRTLIARGLDQSVIRSFVESGPEQAGDIVAALAVAGDDELREINSIQTELAAQATEFGGYLSGLWMDAGIAAQQAIVAPLEAQKNALEAAINGAKAYLETLKTERQKALDEARATYEQEKALLEEDNRLLLERMDEIAAEIEGLIAELAATLPVETLKAGQDAAQKLLDGFKKKYPKVFDELNQLMTALARSMARETTITIRTVYAAAGPLPGRAAGGPVQARTAYLVGERGPEVFMPYSRGNIIPNHELGSTPRMSLGTRSSSVTVEPGAVQINIPGGMVGSADRLEQYVSDALERGLANLANEILAS